MTVLSPRIATTQAGIFYKEVVNDENKVVDKVFIIRYNIPPQCVKTTILKI